LDFLRFGHRGCTVKMVDHLVLQGVVKIIAELGQSHNTSAISGKRKKTEEVRSWLTKVAWKV
jgi:hypothetical protein